MRIITTFMMLTVLSEYLYAQTGDKVMAIKAPDEVRAVCIKTDTVLLATAGEGVYQFNRKDMQLQPMGFNKELKGTISDLKYHPDGSLYVATDKGLYVVRHDTIRQLYNIEKGFASNNIRSLEITSDGVIWAGTDKGLIRMDRNSYRVYTVANGLPDNSIQMIRSDIYNRVWIVSDDQLMVLSGDSLKNLKNTSGSMPLKNIKDIAFDEKGNALVALKGGLVRFNQMYPFLESAENVISLSQDEFGRIFGIINRQLVHFDFSGGIRHEPLSNADFGNQYKPAKVYFDIAGNKYCIDKSWLIFIQVNEEETFYKQSLFRLAEAYSLIGEHQQSLRIRCILREYFPVYSALPVPLLHYARTLDRTGQSEESITPYLNVAELTNWPVDMNEREKKKIQASALLGAANVYQRRQDNFCIGYYRRIIQDYDSLPAADSAFFNLGDFYLRKGLRREAAEVLEDFIVRFPKSGRYWEAVAKLMSIYRESDPKRFSELSSGFFANCTDVTLLSRFETEYEDYQFSKLVAMYESKADKRGLSVLHLQTQITCASRELNTWWLGTRSDGIYRITLNDEDGIQFHTINYGVDSGFTGRSVNHIMTDSKGNIWISCMGDDVKTGGLFQYDGVKFRQYNSRNGLGSDIVFAACEKNSKIWCLSSKGIFAADLSNRLEWKKIAPVTGVFDFVVDAQERMVVTDGNQCIIMEKGQSQIIGFEDSVGSAAASDLTIRKIESGVEGYTYIYTSQGLYREIQGKAKPVFPLSSGYERNTLTFFMDGDDTWFGHSGGITRYHSLYTIHYDTADGLPAGQVVGLDRWKQFRVTVTNSGMAVMWETPLDTVKMARSVYETEKQMVKKSSYSQARQLYRRVPKNTLFKDYADYRVGMLFRKESKHLEAFAWFKEHAYNGQPFITPYLFWSLCQYFNKQNDPDRAFNILLDGIGCFSEISQSKTNRADTLKNINLTHTVDMKKEKNLMLVSFGKGVDEIAFDCYRRNDMKQSVLWYLRASQIFQNQSDYPAGILEIARTLESQGDAQGALRLYRAVNKNAVPLENSYLFSVWWKLAGLYNKSEQYKESAAFFRKLAESDTLSSLRQELTKLIVQAESYGSLGVRKGGYDEANITNDMVFEGNYLWLGTSKGVIRWDLLNNSYKKWNEKNGLVVDNIYSVAISPDGGKWFGGYKMLPNGQIIGGVSYFDGETFTNFSKGQGLTTNEVHCVAVDKSGSVWIGTDQGVSKFKNGWKHYPLKNKLPFSHVTGLAFDSGNRLWIGCLSLNDFYSASGGLIRFDDSLPAVLREKNGLSSNNVKSLIADEMDNLWLNTDKGITVYNTSSQSFNYLNETNGLSSLMIRDVEFADSNCLWICTNRGITKLDWFEHLTRSSAVSDRTATIIHYTEKDGLLTNDVRRAAYHPDHGIWIGTKRGSFSIGQISSERDDDSDITAYNKKLFEISNESESLFEKAQQYIETGDFDKAREIYLDVLDRSGTQSWADDAVLLLAKSYEMEGNYEESQKYYETLIQQYPGSDLVSEAYIGIGMIAEKKNKYDEAIDAYGKAEMKTDNKAVVSQTQFLKQKAEIKKITYERAQTEMLAAMISEKTNELGSAKEKDADEIRKELQSLENQARKSAKAAGYELRLYKVKPDDTLWDLSRQFLDDPNKWKDFFVANEGKISDPNMIYQGQTIVVLTMEKGYREKLEKFLTYNVTAGEDLAAIAVKLYGDEQKWIVIYQANKEKCPNSPKKSLPAMQIFIPVE